MRNEFIANQTKYSEVTIEGNALVETKKLCVTLGIYGVLETKSEATVGLEVYARLYTIKDQRDADCW